MQNLNRILFFILVTLLLAIAVAFSTGFLKVTPAYASGSIQVSASEYQAVQIISASTDDPGKRRDPGQDRHVGRCTTALRNHGVTFNIYHGYPDYQCTLSLEMQNQGKKAVQLQNVVADLPEGILLMPLDPTAKPVLKPGEKATLRLWLRILPIAAENVTYPIVIQMVFEDSSR
jgi:hypothetical protein